MDTGHLTFYSTSCTLPSYGGSYPLQHKFFSVFNFDKSNLLLTDAITTGAEARKILQISPFKFKAFGGFKKVCGYMALKNTLDQLQEEFPTISFKFLKIIENLDEYYKEHKKMTYVYQKRMESIDEEHENIIVEIKPDIKIDEIKSRIESIVRLNYGDNFELLDNELGIDTKFNFTVYIDNPVEWLHDTFNVKLQNGDKLNKLAIRFKFSSIDSKLRIMALTMPDLNKETRFQHAKRFIFSTCSRNVQVRICKVPFYLRLLISPNRGALCSECVDSNISNTLLEDIYSQISKSGLMIVS